jgi:peroxin-11B
MSLVSLSSQVVLHPVVSQNIRLLSTTVGREKTLRAVQNFARILAYLLLLRGQTISAQRWGALQSHLALARKRTCGVLASHVLSHPHLSLAVVQLGKPVEHLQAALRAQSTSEAGERYASTARQLSYAGYLALDAVVWANAVRFLLLKPTTAARINKAANRLWLAGILFSLTHGLLKAGRLAQDARRLRTGGYGEKDLGAETERQAQVKALNSCVPHVDHSPCPDRMLAVVRQRATTRYQFIMDCVDVWLPATALGFVGVNDGLVGLCGLITSVMALRTQWHGLNSKKD